MASDYSCMIIDADPLIRAGLRCQLGPEPDVHELAEGGDAHELLASIGRIDLALVEFVAGRGSGDAGPALIRELLSAQPSIGIVARSRCTERHHEQLARRAGAHAFIGARAVGEVITAAVAAGLEQRPYTDPAIGRGDGATRLTKRQREVLQLLADGLGTVEIAQRLALSEETVRAHAKGAIARLEARDRAHAVAIALRRGQIV